MNGTRIAALVLCIALSGLASVGPGAREACGQEARLAVGDPAPAFEATDEQGARWRSGDYVGKKILVVYFYPAAMTGGCTKQACGFRDNRTRLTEMGAEVVGISGDTPSNLQLFKKAHRLNFPLLSDARGTVARKFGVPVRAGGAVTREVDGEAVTLVRDVTTARWTFIIDLDGRIVYKETEVDAERDAREVIAAIQRLQGR